MPTNYTDQFFLIDPFAPPPVGSAMNFVVYTLTDQDDDGDIGRAGGDLVNGLDVTASYPGDTVTINVPGTGNITYTGITFYLAGGGRVFTPTDGQVLQNGTFVSSTWVSAQSPLLVGDLGPPCFASGTLIETDEGPRRVEDIKAGDLIRTLDHGLQAVTWTGSRRVEGIGKMAPIRFAPGAIGNARALLVSPQHKVLVDDWRAQLLFGCDEVLVAAAHLVNGTSITRLAMREVSYHHLMLNAHEVIFSEGVRTESLYPGDQVLCDPEVRGEIEALFPELVHEAAGWNLARRSATMREGSVLARSLELAA